MTVAWFTAGGDLAEPNGDQPGVSNKHVACAHVDAPLR